MAFLTISTWDLSEITDMEGAIEQTNEHFASLKALGVEKAYYAQLSDTEGVIVAIYPSEATRDRVRKEVVKMREVSSDGFSSLLTTESAGEVRASI